MTETKITKLVLATRNNDKINEIRHFLYDLPMDILSIDDFKGIPDIEEDGLTLEENAIKKARIVAGLTGEAALADDTGLEVDYLNGAPGVYSSRFAGLNATYKDNVNKLLEMMQSVTRTNRKARFRTVIALVRGDQVITVEGICDGIITESPRGKNGFGYDPVFFVPEYQKTFAEMGLEMKNKISHRGLALKKIRELLKN